MDTRRISFSYNVYSDRSSMNEVDALLLLQAQNALKSAYAPYSKFHVGVAIRTLEGETVTGSNQENGAFPIGQCAERVALYRLVHEHGRKQIDSIAIVVDNEHQLSPASPCGSCRQILSEYRGFQETPIKLILCSSNSDEIIEIEDVSHLLPFAFDGLFLGQ